MPSVATGICPIATQAGRNRRLDSFNCIIFPAKPPLSFKRLHPRLGVARQHGTDSLDARPRLVLMTYSYNATNVYTFTPPRGSHTPRRGNTQIIDPPGRLVKTKM